jgi:6-phosphogluconolactonase
MADSVAATAATEMGGSSSSATLLVASSLDEVSLLLNTTIARTSRDAIQRRGVFTIAFSGGSLPSFLATIDQAFERLSIPDPMYACWHVLLADERCVPSDDSENNLRSIRENFLSKVAIPEAQVHGIDESLLNTNDSTSAIAAAYEVVVKNVVKQSGGLIDCALLGFGPDGTIFLLDPPLHSCSFI